MDFDFEAGLIHYATTFHRGQKAKYDPPVELLRFLEPHFVNLIVFDGELPQALLDSANTRAEEAIEAFFQLYLLDELGAALNGIWEKRADKVGATAQAGLTARKNRRDELRSKVRELKEALREASAHTDILEQDVAELRGRRDLHTGRTEELRTKREELQRQLEFAAEDVATGSGALMDRLREPHKFNRRVADALVQLRDHLDRLKLPESTSRRFFEELLEEVECICGRPLDESSKDSIRRKSEQYLADDAAGVINALKTDVARMVEAVEAPTASLSELGQRLAAAAHDRDAIDTRLTGIAQQLVEQGDDELAVILSDLEAKESRLGKLVGVIEELTRKPKPTDRKTDDSLLCIAFWDRELEDAENAYAEVTETLTLRQNTQTLRTILSRARQIALRQLSDAIVEDMNRNLSDVLEGHEITVEAIDRSLILSGQKGASQGQTLAVGYSFLSTLFGRGHNSLPFVVDAPALALDTRVASEVGGKLPHICPQFVGFIIDRERAGFVPALERSAGSDNVIFLTAFADRPENQELLDKLPPNGVQRVEGGVIVRDRAFFDSVEFREEERDG